MYRLINIIIVLIFFSSHVQSSSLQVEKIVSGLSIPWGMAFIDNEHLLVSERNGHLLVIDLKSQKKIKLMDNPTDLYAAGQGGWLDIALSPFERNKVYVTYSRDTTSGPDTTLAVFEFDSNRAIRFKNLLTTTSFSDTSRHFGSRLAFSDEHIFMSIGDRGIRENGQSLSTHAGSILRLSPDGSPAKNNPFIDKSFLQEEIYSFGHRNPQGLFYDKTTRDLWSIEHGPRGGDEINLIKKGANYGWPITSHGKEYWGPFDVSELREKEGVESPKKVYIPSIAPSSLMLYRGNNYPDLDGKLLAPALKLMHINVITLNENKQAIDEHRLFEDLKERIRHIIVSPDDELFFSTDQGNIYKILPSQVP